MAVLEEVNKEVDSTQKILAIAAHLGYMCVGLGILIIPLLIWIFKRNDAFVAHHAKQAFFTQLLVNGLIFILAIGVGVVCVSMDLTGDDMVYALVGVGIIPIIAWVISAFYAAAQALNGEYFYSPLLYVLGMRKPKS